MWGGQSWRLALGSKNVVRTDDSLRRAVELPRSTKRLISVCADTIIIPLALWSALSLKAGSAASNWRTGPPTCCRCHQSPHLRAIRSVPGGRPFPRPQGRFRRRTGRRIERASCDPGRRAQLPALSVSVVTIYSCLALLYVAGSRFVVRYYLLTRYIQPTEARVAIYGAGEAGARLSSVLSTTRAFDPGGLRRRQSEPAGRMVNGIKCLLAGQLPALIEAVDRPGAAGAALADRRRRREILSALEPLGVHVQTVPEFEQLVTGKAKSSDIREVDVCDLLGRDSVPPKAGLFDACIRDKVRHGDGRRRLDRLGALPPDHWLGPKRLVLFEMSELALYNIERELRTVAEQKSLHVELVGLIGNGHHKLRMREMFLGLSACRLCITPPPTSMCQSSSRT